MDATGSESREIAVGIPTKDNEDTIEQTLRQLERQTRKPDRVIVVDASDDATPEKVRTMAAKLDIYVEYHRQSERGRGVGGARKDIYEHFDADILVCLDTDHSVDEKWLKTHAAFHAEREKFGILSNSSRSGFDARVDDPKNSDYFGQSNCSIKREALDAVNGWDPWFQRGEDWDMRIRLWSAGVKSWAKNEIETERFERDVAKDAVSWFHTKVTASPSSVTFLRKYGLWYLRFHPLHVLGDALSALSLLLLLLIPIGAMIAPVSLMALVGIPSILALGFLYYKGPRKRDGFTLLPKDLTSIPVFFALGLSAAYNLRHLGGDEEWNYSGFDPKESN